MLWFAFDPGARTIVLLVPLFVCIGISMLVGVFFPYVRTDLIDQSIVGDRKWLGIHRMSIMCAAGTIIMAFWSWNMLEDPIASGTDRTPLWVDVGGLSWASPSTTSCCALTSAEKARTSRLRSRGFPSNRSVER